MAVDYLEIVSNDLDTLTALYERMHDFSFGEPDPRSRPGPCSDSSGWNSGGHSEAAGGA